MSRGEDVRRNRELAKNPKNPSKKKKKKKHERSGGGKQEDRKYSRPKEKSSSGGSGGSGSTRRNTSTTTGRGRRDSGSQTRVTQPTNNRTTRSGAIGTGGTGSGAINSKANERREGARRAAQRGNPVGALGGYTLTRWIGDAGKTIASLPDVAMKGALANAGTGRKGGQVNAPTKRNDRLNPAQERKTVKYKEQQEKNKQRRRELEEKGYTVDISVWNPKTKKNETKTVEYTNPVATKGREAAGRIGAWEDKTKKKWLEYGTKDMSDVKNKELPKFVDYIPGGEHLGLVSGKKQREEAKKAYDKSLAQFKNDQSLSLVRQINSIGAENGFEDDTIVTSEDYPDGIAWKDLKKKLVDDGLKDLDAGINEARNKYLESDDYKSIGKFSSKDIGKKSIEMGSELIDYMIPYGLTNAKAVAKAEKILSKAKGGRFVAKTTKAGEKVLTEQGQKALLDLTKKYIKSGKTNEEAIKLATKKVFRSDAITSVEKELLANAMQDAVIGTPLDYVKGRQMGLKGDEMKQYMLQNAVLNFAMGTAMSGVAGRTGRAGKVSLAKGMQDTLNPQLSRIGKMSKENADELLGLIKKQENGVKLSSEDTTRLKQLQREQSSSRAGVVRLDKKGNIVVDNGTTANSVMSKSDMMEYSKLQAQYDKGVLKPSDAKRLRELDTKIKQARQAVESNADFVVKYGGKKDVDIDRKSMESAVKYYEKIGDKARLKKAQEILDNDIKITTKHNESIVKNAKSMETATGARFVAVDNAKMKEIVGQGDVTDNFFVKAHVVYEDGMPVVYINKETPQAYQSVMGHDAAHLIKDVNETQFNKLGERLRDYARSLGEYDAFEAEIKRNYPELDKAGQAEEFTCELIGRYIFGKDDTFIKRLAGEEPSLVRKIIEYIKDMVRRLDDPELAKEYKAIADDVEKLIGEVKAENVAKDFDGVKYSKERIPSATETGPSNELFKELNDLEAEWNELGKKKYTPEIGKRAEEITARIDKIYDQIGESRVTMADADGAIKDIEANRADDESLINRNEDIVKNSDDELAGIERSAPDPGELPKGMKVNKKAAKEAKAEAVDVLKGSEDLARDDYIDFTDAEIKEIDDSVDRISNMIANGDKNAAKAEAKELVEKYHRYDEYERLDNEDYKEKRAELRAAKKSLRSNAWVMPDGSARTLKEFYEVIGLPREGTRNLPIRRWPKLSYVNGLKGVSGRVVFRGGKTPTHAVDELWADLTSNFPNYFKESDAGDPIAQFKSMAEVAMSDPKEAVPEYFKVWYGDAEIKAQQESAVNDILDIAEKNAGAYKGVDEPKPLKSYDNMDVKQLEAHIIGENVHLKNAINIHGENAPRVKEIQEHIAGAERRLDELRGETKPEVKTDVKTETKPDTKTEVKPETKVTAKAEKKEAVKSEAKGEVAEPKKEPVGFGNILDDEKTPAIFKESAETKAEPEKGGPDDPDGPDGYSVVKSDGSVDSKFNTWFGDKFTSFRRKTESSLVGFEKVAAKTGNKKLRSQTTKTFLAKNKISSWIEGDRAAFGGAIKGDGVNQIFEKHNLFGKANAEKKTDFSNYLLYLHAIDRLKAGKPVHLADGGGSAFKAEDYQALIKKIEDKYPPAKKGEKSELQQFREDIKGYFDDLMQYRVDAGLVSKEFAETMARKYPDYVPTYRDGDDWLDVITEGESYRADIGQSVKTAKGGSEPIQDLYQQMIRVTKDTINKSEQNALMNVYADALGIKPETLPEGATLNDIADAAIKASESGSGGWRVTFWSEGQPVTMGVNKQIALGLRDFNGESFKRLVSACSKFNKLGTGFKHLITDWNIIFGVRNGARDLQQAAVNSKNTAYFTKSIPSSWAAIARPKKNPYMRLYMANGGKYSALVQQGKNFVEPKSKGAISSAADASFGRVIDRIEKVNGAIELAPRLAEFIGTINKHADSVLEGRGSSVKKLREEVANDLYPKKSLDDLTADELEKVEDGLANKLIDIVGKDVIDEAMHNSADITLNFSRSGVIGKALNAGPVPYINPSIQGLSKTIRLFSESKADGAKALLNLGMKIGAITIAPAMFNEFMLADDKAYQSLNTRDKDTNFFIPIGDGKFIKVPKPRENAVLAEPATYGLRYFFDKAHVGVIEEGEYSGWKDLGQMFKSAADNIGPVNPLTDNLFSPLLNTALNKTWFGGSIEDTSDVLAITTDDPLRKKNKSEIYDESTSAVAKWIGNQKIGNTKISDIPGIGMSPKKIDNLMDSYLGIIYDLGISQTSDASYGNPVVNQFVKDSVFSNKNGMELWNEFGNTMNPTLGDKAKHSLKKAALGNTRWTIQDKTIEAKDWLNLKGYDDITYSDARNKILYDKELTDKQKKAYDRKVKKLQNDLRHDLVYGHKEVTPENDPVRKLAGMFGVDKAMNQFTYTYVDPETGEKRNQHLDAWKAYKKSDEYKGDSKKAGEKFIDFYSKMRWTNGRIGESKSFPSWMTASVLAATEKGKNDDLAKSYIRADWDKDGSYVEGIVQRGKNYRDNGFTQKDYRQSQKTIFDKSRDLKYDYMSNMQPWDKAMALATDKKKYADGAYYSADTDGKVSRRMNYARYLSSEGHDTEEINKFAKKYDLKIPKIDYDNTTSKERGEIWRNFNKQVETAVNKAYKDSPDEIKAAVYHVITDDSYSTPFGTVRDMSQDNDTGLAKLDEREPSKYGGRRRGRRGYRRRGRRGGYGGGSGGGSGSVPKTASGAIQASVTNPFKGFKEVGGKSGGKVSDLTTKSNLDEAYRKKARKLMEKNYKRLA